MNEYDRSTALTKIDAARREGKVIGFTSGVFDLLHRGHVEYLDAARTQCDFLVVGVNSDRSVRENKGPHRPIVGEADRVRVVASLRSVDCAYIFDEANNHTNVELLRPDRYIKAGDYSRTTLTSASLVESYGGKVVLVPFAHGLSSTSIIGKIESQLVGRMHVEGSTPPREMRPALFLDRDGTINEDEGYLSEPERFRLYPGVLDAMRRFQECGYRLIVVTNQPGIGLGYYTRQEFYAVNRRFLKLCNDAGVQIDAIYYCPHSQSVGCRCRKPGTELIERAVEEQAIQLSGSIIVGDQSSDIQLAKLLGCWGVLVRTGHAGKDGKFTVTPDQTVDSLADLAPEPVLERR